MDCVISSEDFMDMVKDRLHDYWCINVLEEDEFYPEIWEQFCNYIDDFGNQGHDVMYIADNFKVNGDYGSFDDYLEDDETDEQLIEWLDENAYWYDAEKRICIIHFGI
jgi:hypothetical protein